MEDEAPEGVRPPVAHVHLRTSSPRCRHSKSGKGSRKGNAEDAKMDFEKQIEAALHKQKITKGGAFSQSDLARAEAQAAQYHNNADVETAWAIKAGKHAETYFNLISSVDSRKIKLTPIDDEIYADFRKTFPDLNVRLIDEDTLKAPSSKEAWRDLCNRYEGKVQDFNYGTMLRLDATDDYGPENSTFVPRVQFYAIEIARNREGDNMAVCKFAPEEKQEEAKKEFEAAEAPGTTTQAE